MLTCSRAIEVNGNMSKNSVGNYQSISIRQIHYRIQKNNQQTSTSFSVGTERNLGAQKCTYTYIPGVLRNMNKFFQWEEKTPKSTFVCLLFWGNDKRVKTKESATVFPCAMPVATNLKGYYCLNNNNRIQRSIKK